MINIEAIKLESGLQIYQVTDDFNMDECFPISTIFVNSYM